MSKRESSNCHRCGSVLLPSAEVCSTCCAPQDGVGPQPFHTATAEPAVAVPADVAPEPQSGLGAWPFGQVDAEAAAQVAARYAAADVRAELDHYSSAQTATHLLAGIPEQRPAPEVRQDDIPSVPPVGPNPFLAAARMQNARDEAAAVEGYPV